MAHKFKGEDRRVIEKTLQGMRMIQRRDEIALILKPTSAISTRELVQTLDDSALAAAWILVRNRLQACLDETA